MDIKMLAQAKPILMSTPMVQASMSDIEPKTQTRRVIQPTYRKDEAGFQVCTNKANGERWVEKYDENEMSFDAPRYVKPKYRVGDILWVRETWAKKDGHYFYKAGHELLVDGEPLIKKWKPSIHMPREAARIFLQVTDVRAERLQDISHKDRIAEGIKKCHHKGLSDDLHCGCSLSGFVALWDNLNAKRDGGKYAWDMNPWVWVYTFERIAGHLDKQIGGKTFDTGHLSISN